MSLVNMKTSPKEAQEYMAPSAGDAPEYPYGLCLCLSTESLNKLGITELPAVGSKLMVMANVTVTSVRSSQQIDGDKDQGADLQITDMALSAPTETDLAGSLWPTK